MGKYWKGVLKRKVWVEIGGGEVGRGGDQKGQDGGGGRDGKDCQDVVESSRSLPCKWTGKSILIKCLKTTDGDARCREVIRKEEISMASRIDDESYVCG